MIDLNEDNTAIHVLTKNSYINRQPSNHREIPLNEIEWNSKIPHYGEALYVYPMVKNWKSQGFYLQVGNGHTQHEKYIKSLRKQIAEERNRLVGTFLTSMFDASNYENIKCKAGVKEVRTETPIYDLTLYFTEDSKDTLKTIYLPNAHNCTLWFKYPYESLESIIMGRNPSLIFFYYNLKYHFNLSSLSIPKTLYNLKIHSVVFEKCNEPTEFTIKNLLTIENCRHYTTHPIKFIAKDIILGDYTNESESNSTFVARSTCLIEYQDNGHIIDCIETPHLNIQNSSVFNVTKSYMIKKLIGCNIIHKGALGTDNYVLIDKLVLTKSNKLHITSSKVTGNQDKLHLIINEIISENNSWNTLELSIEKGVWVYYNNKQYTGENKVYIESGDTMGAKQGHLKSKVQEIKNKRGEE